jgi:molybdenum cofactor synthesis domain-containing protein
MTASDPTAAVLIIGEEILSGRTQDTNLAFIAKYLAAFGIPVREARVVPDVAAEIAAAVNHLRRLHTYVFTTGGIGPTHDDITADSIADAFGVAISENAEALAMLGTRYAPQDLNAARRRMARIPHGATLVPNAVSTAPGFQIENVFVMAGIPAVMQSMMDTIGPRLQRGRPLLSKSLTVFAGEGVIAAGLAAVQKRFPDLPMGSYPFFRDGKYGTTLVVRGADPARLGEAFLALEIMAGELGLMAIVAEGPSG